MSASSLRAVAVNAATSPTQLNRNRRPALGRQARRLLTVHLPLAVLCLVWLLPTLALLVSSLRTPTDASSTGWWEAFVPPLRFTTYNYEVVLDSGVGRAFLNSLLITVPAVSVMTTLGLATSYVLARMRFRGAGVVYSLLVALTVIPVQMVLVPVLQLYNATGVSGTWPGIWAAHGALALPFTSYLLYGFFRDLPSDMFEAAEIDGCDPTTSFLRIAIPTALPALGAVVVFQFLWVWNDLLISLVFLGGQADVAPLTVVLTGLASDITGQNWNLLSAAAFVSMACPLLVFLLLQRTFVRGIVAGSVK